MGIDIARGANARAGVPEAKELGEYELKAHALRKGEPKEHRLKMHIHEEGESEEYRLEAHIREGYANKAHTFEAHTYRFFLNNLLNIIFSLFFFSLVLCLGIQSPSHCFDGEA